MVRISFSAMNRILEDHFAKDPRALEEFRRQGRAVLSDGRAMTDDQLLEKLRSLQVPMDRARFEHLAQRHLSAQTMARDVIESNHLDLDTQEDWVWIAFTCLWERWLPERPSLEMIDDLMQQGYRVREETNGVPQACRLWLEAWQAILRISEERQLRSVDEFDALSCGTHSLFNWVQDLEMALQNAGFHDPQFLRERISLCQTFFERFPEDSESLTPHFKRALADSHFQLGERQTGDQLYRQWLDEDPQWGWGWIGWSDNHFLFAKEKDAESAERILKQGLETPGVNDRVDLLDRLADLYEETGQAEKAEAVRREAAALGQPESTTTMTSSGSAVRVKTKIDFGKGGLPLDEFAPLARSLRESLPPARPPIAPAKHRSPRVGRNDPCPCGSGKKFKKCCGGR